MISILTFLFCSVHNHFEQKRLKHKNAVASMLNKLRNNQTILLVQIIIILFLNRCTATFSPLLMTKSEIINNLKFVNIELFDSIFGFLEPKRVFQEWGSSRPNFTDKYTLRKVAIFCETPKLCKNKNCCKSVLEAEIWGIALI